ncbi:MAG: AmmeMemoRadiSam system protein B [Candidatus Micrarchaeota archaeon]
MRAAAVAGYFYPLEADALERMVSDCMLRAKQHARETSAYGGVCPHAGYQYSGVAAAATYMSIREMENAHTVVVIGPNHSGGGSLLSLSLDDWETPLGEVKNDTELGKLIQGHAKYLDFDERAHVMEHSVEVQVPFIQMRNQGARIVPICMMDQGLEASLDLGKAIFDAVSEYKKEVVVIASSDFSHYAPPEVAKKNDMSALSFITGMDPEGFQKRVSERGWSICGYGPVTALLEYAKRMKCRQGELLYYTNSGEYGGGGESVVGYASVVFPKKAGKKK